MIVLDRTQPRRYTTRMNAKTQHPIEAELAAIFQRCQRERGFTTRLAKAAKVHASLISRWSRGKQAIGLKSAVAVVMKGREIVARDARKAART